MHRLVSVERAMLISAWGRILSVGFDEAVDSVVGVIEALKRGHSSIALESVLRRIGRYVRRL